MALSEPLPAPPHSISLLLEYLTRDPLPTEVNLDILNVPTDEDDVSEVLDSMSATSNYPERSYAKVETHLGIHAPDLPRLASEFREDYSLLRQKYRRCFCNDDMIGDYSSVINNSDSNSVDELVSRIWNTTTCLLLICPDHCTAWADRRRALLMSAKKLGEEALRLELVFLDLLFTQHSKA